MVTQMILSDDFSQGTDSFVLSTVFLWRVLLVLFPVSYTHLDVYKRQVIELLTQKDNTEVSQLLVERAIADKEGADIKSAFWKFGFIIPASEAIILRPVEPNDRASFLSLQGTNPLLQSMEEKEPFLDLDVYKRQTPDSLPRMGSMTSWSGAIGQRLSWTVRTQIPISSMPP